MFSSEAEDWGLFYFLISHLTSKMTNIAGTLIVYLKHNTTKIYFNVCNVNDCLPSSLHSDLGVKFTDSPRFCSLCSSPDKVKLDHTWKHTKVIFWNVAFQHPCKVFLLISYTRELYGSSADIWEWHWAAWATIWVSILFQTNFYFVRESLVKGKFCNFWHEILCVCTCSEHIY